jgi:hypothetical protein
MFEHKPFKEQLIGYDSEENSYLVSDYPYGFRLRTQIRYWIDTTKNHGQRACSQTKNPKNGIWNKPKKGTYSSITVMGLDENDHVSFDGIHMGCDEKEVLNFQECFKLESDYQKKEILLIHGMARGQKYVTWTVTSGSALNDKPRQTIQEQIEINKKVSLIGLSEVLHEKSLSVKDVL